MAKEVEYKYILNYLPDKVKQHTGSTIWQGYIYISPRKQVRVRLLANDSLTPTYKKAWMCVKYHEGNIRDEFEVEMDFEEAKKLYALCEYKLTKTRYGFAHGGYRMDFDVYPDGDMIVEIEVHDSKGKETDKKEIEEYLPEWVKECMGENVDGQWKYNNYCKAGFPEENYK